MPDKTPPPEWRGMRPHQLLERLGEDTRLGQAFDDLGRALMRTLDGRTYETIALRVSARRDCRYMWSGHCVIALRRDVLSIEEIARIADGADALTGTDAVLVRAVDELLDRTARARAVAALGPRAVPVTIATYFYDAISVLMNDAPPEADARPPADLATPTVAVRRLRERWAA